MGLPAASFLRVTTTLATKREPSFLTRRNSPSANPSSYAFFSILSTAPDFMSSGEWRMFESLPMIWSSV